MTEQITAEKLFLSKYGNKITASESWVIRFAEEYADEKTKYLQSRLDVATKALDRARQFIWDMGGTHNFNTDDIEKEIVAIQEQIKTNTPT